MIKKTIILLVLYFFTVCSLEPEPLDKKNQEPEPIGKKNQEPETEQEPEPLEKKSRAGAGAAKKFASSPALLSGHIR